MYGENGAQLRAELATLLRQHRLQRRLGEANSLMVPDTTTPQERAVLGALVARYRQSVLVWCRDAVRASTPQIDLRATRAETRGPAEELRFRLDAAIQASTAELPTVDQLANPQQRPIVETWRLAARAAALGEHDFTADVSSRTLTGEQCMTVLKDAAEITRALVGIVHRYDDIPGWQGLHEPVHLARAAEVCATFAGFGGTDYTVDRRGWRPPLTPVAGDSLTGLTGVLQAQHNLLAELRRFPNAHDLRLVLDSQRIVSHHVAQKTTEARLVSRWQARAQTYGTLVRESRDVHGLLGDGGLAAAQASVAAARTDNLQSSDLTNLRDLRHLDALFSSIDTRVADIIDRGASEMLYLRRVRLPRLTNESHGLVKPVRTRHVPLDTPPHTELLDVVTTQLRPPPRPARPPAGAARSRAELNAATTHRLERHEAWGL